MKVGAGGGGFVADEAAGGGPGEGEGLFLRNIGRSGTSKLLLRSEEAAGRKKKENTAVISTRRARRWGEAVHRVDRTGKSTLSVLNGEANRGRPAHHHHR